MATRPRSQSTTPKPPSPSPLLISTTPSSSTLSSSSSSTTIKPQPPPPVVFNTTMFASSSTLSGGVGGVGSVHDRDVVQQARSGPSSQDLPSYSQLHSSHPPPPSSSDFYPVVAGVINTNSFGGGNNNNNNNNNNIGYMATHSQPRSMSIQSLVSSTSSNTFADDDASSTISHTTTRNTEDLDEDQDSTSLSVDIDDPDVRMAAEALGDLRADFVSSPKSIPPTSPISSSSKKEDREERRQETMMEMIQGQNTFLGTAVRAGRSVYRGGKRYSPRFKYGAEMVERAAAPMTSVVSYAARTTGVESVLRRNLEARRLSSSGASSTTTSQSSPSHSQPSSSTSSHATKRRKTQFEEGREMDVDSSPNTPSNEREDQLTHKPATDVVSLNWQRRLMLSTAGVGVALSEESLKSLKYCLAWLRWANDHLDKVVMALRGVISEYDSDKSRRNENNKNKNSANDDTDGDDDERSIQLQHKIDNLRKDVIGTLKRVVDVVSTYAGGALPENARVVVKACITNLPRRWALAAKDDPSGSNNTTNGSNNNNNMALVVRKEEEAGKRVLVLAREGLEMLHQVSAIVTLTLERAEEWCERLGRKRPEEGDYGKVGWDVDIEMDDTEESRKSR
ncbi:hypothetical protein AA313_de0208453 [Arthrobotrys entomopaga]|nr:hypothetical protein AA313_de0208453 [Arthrobotrys entomopaga]